MSAEDIGLDKFLVGFVVGVMVCLVLAMAYAEGVYSGRATERAIAGKSSKEAK